MEGTSALPLECRVLQLAALAAQQQEGRYPRCFCQHDRHQPQVKIKPADYLNWLQNDSQKPGQTEHWMRPRRLPAGKKSGLSGRPCAKLAPALFNPIPSTIFINYIHQQPSSATITN
jgi:hypothetical protein